MKTISEILSEFNKLIDSLPSRVNETPRKVLEDFFRQALTDLVDAIPSKKKISQYYNQADYDYIRGDNDHCEIVEAFKNKLKQ